ncbi:Putative ribonuclease H protein At1g65750 [Linum perenne]
MQGYQGGNGSINSQEKYWKWLWKLTLPPKLKIFLWRVSHDAMATKVNLAKRKCAATDICPICRQYAETQEHIFFVCNQAPRMWNQILPHIPLLQAGERICSWLERMKDITPNETMINICYLLWTVWKSRNKAIFEGTETRLNTMVFQYRSELNEWNIYRTRDEEGRGTAASALQIPPTTQTPMTFHRKIMCDGAFKADIQYGAYGVIVYDSEGRVVDGRARSFFCRAPICAEALAVLEAVQIAFLEQGDIVIFTDSKTIVSALDRQYEEWPWEVAGFIAQIKQWLTARSNIQIRWVNRQVISEVDRIAKMARDNCLPPNWVDLL